MTSGSAVRVVGDVWVWMVGPGNEEVVDGIVSEFEGDSLEK